MAMLATAGPWSVDELGPDPSWAGSQVGGLDLRHVSPELREEGPGEQLVDGLP